MVKFQARRDADAAIAYFLGDSQLSEEEKEGVWLGSACEPARIRVGQQVTREDFAAVLNGRAPCGELLLSNRKANRRVAWDAVVTPDKSISVAALCLAQDIARRVRDAFAAAVSRLFIHMESLAHRQAPISGAPFIPTGNLMAAQFVHQASRHADPHLHAHLLIINATHCEDRRWRSLEPSPLYRHQRALKFVFNAHLQTELTQRGFAAAIDPRDSLSKLPVPAAICRAFSKAHAAIVRAAKEIINSGVIAAEWVNLPGSALLQRINERNRPKHRPDKPDWQSLLPEDEKMRVRELILRPAHVPPPPPPPSVPPAPPLTILRERWAKAGKDRLKLKDLVARTAAEFPMVPLGSFSGAAAVLRGDSEAEEQAEKEGVTEGMNQPAMSSKQVAKLKDASRKVAARRRITKGRGKKAS